MLVFYNNELTTFKTKNDRFIGNIKKISYGLSGLYRLYDIVIWLYNYGKLFTCEMFWIRSYVQAVKFFMAYYSDSLYTKGLINKAILIILLGAAAGFTASLFISKKLKKKNQFIMASCIMIVSAG